LLLAARKLIREVVSAIGQRHRLEEFLSTRAGSRSPAAGDAQRQGHIVECVQFVEQIMVLENEPDHPVAKVGPGLEIEVPNLAPIELEVAFIGSIEQAEDVEQSTLADSRGPHDSQYLPFLDFEIEVLEHLNPRLAGTETLAEPGKRHHLSVIHI
jgi:hypothetical protein